MQTSEYIDISDADLNVLVGEIRNMKPSHRKNIIKILKSRTDFSEYQKDPVGFINDILGISLTLDVQKLCESVRDNRITVAKSATGTGKSHGASALAIWFKKSFPRSQVFTIAHPFENQKILWGELETTAVKSKLFESDKINNMEIQCVESKKDFIKALSVPTSGTEEAKEGKFSGKHYDHMLFIVDEGDTVPDFAYRGVEGCMSGGIIVRLVILYNPRSRMGEPARHEKEESANIVHLSAFNHPNVISGKNVIPGAVDRNTTALRISEWCRPLKADEKKDPHTCFELPKFLEGKTAIDNRNVETEPLVPGWHKVMVPQFHYMVLGQYPPEGYNQLISMEWVDAARDRWDKYVEKWGEKPPVNIGAKMGLDCADEGDDSNVATFRYGGYVERPISWPKVDVYEAGDKGAEAYRARKTDECGVDGTGLGAGVAPHMRRLGCNAHKVMVASAPTRKSELGEFKSLGDQLAWEMREWLRADPGSMLPPDKELIEELICPYYYKGDDGKIRLQKKDGTPGNPGIKQILKRSPDKFDSLKLTFIGGLFPRATVTHGGVDPEKDYPYI